MHRRASSRGVPLPDAGADRAAWSVRAGSSLARADGAPGVQAPFAGLLPLTGWARVSTRPGPRVVRAPRSAPIDFRRGDPRAGEKRRSEGV